MSAFRKLNDRMSIEATTSPVCASMKLTAWSRQIGHVRASVAVGIDTAAVGQPPLSITINSIADTGTADVTVGPYAGDAAADPWPPSCALPAGWTVPSNNRGTVSVADGALVIDGRAHSSLMTAVMLPAQFEQMSNYRIDVAFTFAQPNNASRWGRWARLSARV